jgi:cyclopropane fatty-acyl-phospholipid synthase-like methyltransferase
MLARHVAATPPGSRRGAADYYQTLTALYQWYGGTAHGWHYGIYDRTDIRSHEAALIRCNEILMDGVAGEAGSILDVGFGEGGFAIWAAARGHRVVGITVCPDHVPIARSHATAHRVEDRCHFLLMDMDALALRPGSVDIVVNQETWCHSQAKGRYLRGVHAVLRPNGWFRSVDLSIRDGTLSAAEAQQYQAVLSGFELPSLISEAEISRDLAAAGFADASITDLTSQVRRTALLILAVSSGPQLLTRLGIDRLLYRRSDEATRGRYRRHVDACMAFNLGLQRGLFRYLRVTARKPA